MATEMSIRDTDAYWAARDARMKELGFDPDDEDDWCRPDYETGGVDDE